jgi:transglutaminase-like putative cysteine protease
MDFAGLQTTTWITDTGEIVREESPLGFITVRETAERARALAVPNEIRQDLLEAAAVVPAIAPRRPPLPPIDDPRDVRKLRVRLEGAVLSSPDLQGAGQRVIGDVIEIADAQTLEPQPADAETAQYLVPEPLIESDDADIKAAAEEVVRNIAGTRGKAEALVRYVNAIVQKKPTVSLPSAREVFRTRIGDCNEHTALFVAMSRAIGVPARIATGLAYVRGAFYYHAWPEVYLDEGRGLGMWLPVDPTFNQFPADVTHLRLARGGLDKQALILPLIGRLKITVIDLEVVPGSTPVLVGQAAPPVPPVVVPGQRRESRWCLPCFLGGHR